MSKLSVSECAKTVGRSPGTVRRAVRTGELPAERFGERGWWMIEAADLQQYVVKSRKGGDRGSGQGQLGVCG
jgi:excisionase family DNA binding protein